ncbi:MAG: cupin domain-containing protein [Bacteroidales bacterium]|nr:cupin domain-containing protein [Bacteroidales bacterium]MDD4822953.1 cupin domain-containing protein [Bacteroidales bacterium]
MKRIAWIVCLVLICSAARAQYNKAIIIEPLLKTDTTAIGQKIVYPQFKENEVTIAKITFPPGVSTGWHKHEIPVFAYVLKGTLTVELENDKVSEFPENATFAEVFNTYHNGVNKGKEELILIAFYMGGKGVPNSIVKEQPKEKSKMHVFLGKKATASDPKEAVKEETK